MSFFRRPSLCTNLVMRFVRKPTRELKHGINTHRSNQAKKGLYHGKDIRSGNSISFSKKHTKRKWYPNVINKRVWSESLNDWVRFKMTTTALRGIDTEGGIDNYLMNLDDRSVADSNYITKMRRIVGSALFIQGKLSDRHIKQLGFIEDPPTAMPLPEEYTKERVTVPPPPEDLSHEGMESSAEAAGLRFRKSRSGWKTPRYF